MSPTIDLPGCRSVVLDDAAAVAAEAAKRILQAADTAIAERGVFHLVLAGGTTPRAAYRLLAETGRDWQHWQLWYGDERCLPLANPERNSHMVADSWLIPARSPTANDHPIPAELGAEAAASTYAEAISEVLPFDLVLLGIGEDGHTASLFPGQQHDPAEPVHAVHDAPKPPPDRVSLSAGILSSAREVLVLVTGAGKRDAVARWQAGEALPISTIRPTGGATVILDRAAAA